MSNNSTSHFSSVKSWLLLTLLSVFISTPAVAELDLTGLYYSFQFADSRDQFDQVLHHYLETIAPDYIVLAGFMRILGPNIIQAFEHRILNIHPSLLPDYKGLNTHQRVLDNHETQHGVSIHLVTAELDDGPVIAQASYPIEAGDCAEDLQRKGHRLEHQMYPQVLCWLSDNKLTIEGGQLFYEQALLEQPISFSP